MKFKKHFVGVVLIAVICASRLFSFSSNTEMYKHTFLLSNLWSERCDMVKSVIADTSDDSSKNDFFDMVLTHLLIGTQSASNSTEKEAWNECAGLIAEHMGNIRNVEVENSIWALYEKATEPVAKSKILIALGQMQSQTYYSRILDILIENNTTPGNNAAFSEKIAYGAIGALEKYNNEQSYKALFVAEHSWYSKQTRDFAASTRAAITKNLGVQLISIITDKSINREIKDAAVAVAAHEETSLSDADKATIALAAYKEYQGYAASELQDKKQKQVMVETCIKMLIDSKDHSLEAVPLLKESTLTVYTTPERLNAIRALGANGTDGAVAILSDMTAEYNQRRIEGPFGGQEEEFIRTLISALGETKNVKALEALKSVELLGAYTNTIRSLATKAIKQLPNQ